MRNKMTGKERFPFEIIILKAAYKKIQDEMDWLEKEIVLTNIKLGAALSQEEEMSLLAFSCDCSEVLAEDECKLRMLQFLISSAEDEELWD